jgi:hypothetical protein
MSIKSNGNVELDKERPKNSLECSGVGEKQGQRKEAKRERTPMMESSSQGT